MRRPVVLLSILPCLPGRTGSYGDLLVGEMGLDVLAEGMVVRASKGQKGEREVSRRKDTGYAWFLEEGVWEGVDASEAERCCALLR